MTTPSDMIRTAWLETLLPRVPALGWSETAARQAASHAGLDAGDQALGAPGGVADLREAFFDRAEAATASTLGAADLDALRVHERVALGVRTWLDILAPHREAVLRASTHAALPWSTGAAVARTWSIADTIWTAIGDTSQDHNHFTKRALLAATLPAIVTYWQSEPGSDDLDGFIARRLKEAMTLGRTGGRALGPLIELLGRAPGRSA